MRTLAAILLAACCAASAHAAIVGPAKPPPEDQASDKPCRHVEPIANSPHNYRIDFRGTVDGAMTRAPIGYSAGAHGWQPNRSVLIENLGLVEVRNPRIVVNDRRRWHTLAELAAEATRGLASPADRARAIWEFCRRQRFHACTWDAECSDAVKALNVYGYTLCGDEACVINDLWRAAGLTTQRGYPVGHCVSQVLYDGRWHLLDSDEHVICLARDNQTIASEQEVVDDHDLIKRTHTYGINHADSRATDEFSASLYGYEGRREGTRPLLARHRMDLRLRPGESIELRWDHVGKQYSAGTPPEPTGPRHDGIGDLLSGFGPTAYGNLANGKLRYRPDLATAAAPGGVEKMENARFDPGRSQIAPIDSARPALVTWRMASPYVFVGGRAAAQVRLAGKASAEWRFSVDGKKWQSAARGVAGESGELVAVLDALVSPRRRPDYAYHLQLVLEGDASASTVEFDNDVQLAPLSLPELNVGANQACYTDDGPADRRVRVTHCWMERNTWHAPAAPGAAVAPRDGQTVEGSRVAFRWTPAVDPDGDAIADYQFELSDRPDMRWPLSPNFEKLISLTAWRGKPEWAVADDGLLNPDTPYYWRVRACDSRGVWGPWSRPFRFQIAGPGVPLAVGLAVDANGFDLQWRANPQGRPSVAYLVYGSDERGFTVSDIPYRLQRGKGFVASMEEYEAKPAGTPDAGSVQVPANLIARVTTNRLRVVDAGLANKAFYRVVAVDAHGNRSGASDQAQVPRPWLVGRPPAGRVGQPYRWQPEAIRSLGDLRCRPTRKSSYNAAFWDRDQLRFEPLRLPPALSLDPTTGLVTGTPPSPGPFPLEFKVTDQSGRSREFSYQWDVSARQPPP
jgi:hypothetical protein